MFYHFILPLPPKVLSLKLSKGSSNGLLTPILVKEKITISDNEETIIRF